MKDFDSVVFGSGPTGLAVMEKCGIGTNQGKVAFLCEIDGPMGAYAKGVKSVNPIVPKLPNLTLSKHAIYDEITKWASDAESALVSEFEHIYPYSGTSETGIRYCKAAAERDMLSGLTAIRPGFTGIRLNDIADFVSRKLGHKIDDSKLFPYREPIWNVNYYYRRMMQKIPERLIYWVHRVDFIEENNGIVLQVLSENGSTEVIRTQKLIVCRGIGNISFEQNVHLKKSVPARPFNFGVLELSKFFYDDKTGMPPGVSSIMVPEHGVCFTNETKESHSVLFDTNGRLKNAGSFDPDSLNSGLDYFNQEMVKKNPALPAYNPASFRCAMTLNEAAYGEHHDLHFKFLLSPSVVDNIHYVNLPYFTVIRLAMQSLPDKIIDFK